MNIFEEYAQEYFDHGLTVIPISPKTKGTAGMKIKWAHYNRGVKQTPEEIDDLVTRFPAHSIGVVCGKASGVICLDIDRPETDPVVIELLKMLPPIRVGKVGNPERSPSRFFKYNGEKNKKYKNIGIEILSDGGQTVLPPSTHPKYHSYTWVNESLLDIDVDDLPILSPTVIDWIEGKNGTKKSDVSANPPLQSESGRCRHFSWDKMSKIAFAMMMSGDSKEDIIQRILSEDAKYNANADSLLFECPDRAEWKGKPKDKVANANWFVDDMFERNADKIKVSVGSTQEEIIRAFEDDIKSGFTYSVFGKPKSDGEPVEKRVRDPLKLHKFFTALHGGCRITETKGYAIYDGKKFNMEDELFPEGFAQDYYHTPKVTQNNDRYQFLGMCRASNRGGHKVDYMIRETGLINLQNGVYDFNNGVLLKHDQKYKLGWVLPISYDGGATCPTWDKLIDLICMGNANFIKVIQEFIGFCLSADNFGQFNESLILDGGGSNGKSTFLRVVYALLGDENINASSLSSLSERFGSNAIVNKMLSVASEIDPSEFSKTGFFKQATGGDPINVEEKGGKNWTYKNVAKFIITYNEMPNILDATTGLKRRFIIVPLKMNFDKNPEMKLDTPDRTIIANELPGVFLKCINAYAEVKKRNAFTHLAESDARMKEILDNASLMRQFVNEELIVTCSDGDKLASEDVYTRFKMDFCGGYTQFSKPGFIKALRELLKNEFGVTDNLLRIVLDEYHTGNRSQRRGIAGVRFDSGMH